MDILSLFPEHSNEMDPATFEALTDELGLSHHVLAERFSVDLRTIGRWASGETPIPGAVAILLSVAISVQSLSHRWPGPESAAPRARRPRSAVRASAR